MSAWTQNPHKKEGKEKREGGGGVHTPPLSGSLLPVVMVIRGFGQDYEIFYLVTSALLERRSKPARSVAVSPTPFGKQGDGVCDRRTWCVERKNPKKTRDACKCISVSVNNKQACLLFRTVNPKHCSDCCSELKEEGTHRHGIFGSGSTIFKKALKTFFSSISSLLRMRRYDVNANNLVKVRTVWAISQEISVFVCFSASFSPFFSKFKARL